MKILIQIVFVIMMIAIVEFDARASECGGRVLSKKHEECCEGHDKMLNKELFFTCVNKCNGDSCCFYYCLTKGMNLLKDDKVDGETAIASLNKLVEADKNWVEVSINLNF